ncbi:MAG TPA: diguanylate cyclase [Agitococcus sp.]|jgi:diguanylate cyclase (GGDEF)-like protein|nr:GGDEF domain-containing protein [Moraxellaceae bacterium]MCC6373866.1 GGDEF domain-containing protein [Moraxellaceae bacterium]HQV79822.1 diguanylate cyclase [Agitococcus sp.]
MEHFLELKRKLALTLSFAIAIALLIAFVINYSVSKVSIINALVTKELPLTASAVMADLRDERLGLFLNSAPSDYQKRYLSNIDYGLDRAKLNEMLDLYHQEYGHNIYLVNKEMQIVARNNQSIVSDTASLLEINDFKAFTQTLNKDTSSYEIQHQGDTVLINAHYLPSLEWYLLVDTNATQATASLRDALYLNIFVGLFASLSIFGLTHISISRYQWQIKQKLSDMSSSDTLTGLANRYTFDILIGHILANAKRTQTPISLILIDMDLIKSAVLEHGSLTTEKVVQQVGHIIKESIRASDVGCRWSEDKFLITLNNCLPDKATSIAKNLTLSIQQAVTQQPVSINMPLNISAGIADYHINDTLDTLIERTERALVHAQSQTHHKIMYVQAPYYTVTHMTRRLNNKQHDIKAVQMQA